MSRRSTHARHYREHTDVEAVIFIVPMILLASAIAIIMWAVIL